jgi:hypothetical protein
MMTKGTIIGGSQDIDAQFLKIMDKGFKLGTVSGAKNHPGHHPSPLLPTGFLPKPARQKKHGGNPHAAAHQTGLSRRTSDKTLPQRAKKRQLFPHADFGQLLRSPANHLEQNLQMPIATGLMDRERPPQQRILTGGGLHHHKLSGPGGVGNITGIQGQSDDIFGNALTLDNLYILLELRHNKGYDAADNQ